MKKTHRFLRKLLSNYRDEITRKPITRERSNLVDCCTFIIEAINEQRTNS